MNDERRYRDDDIQAIFERASSPGVGCEGCTADRALALIAGEPPLTLAEPVEGAKAATNLPPDSA